MARRSASLGFLGRFGRSGDLRQLDQALRAVDLHPALVPEGVKLTVVNLMKDTFGDEPAAETYLPAASLVAYCALGAEGFLAANGDTALDAVETRIQAAIDAGAGFDADLLLLMLHARLIQPSVVQHFGLSADEA